MWRIAWIPALLTTGFASGQALPPLGITASQSVTTYSVTGGARLFPGGGAYVSGTWDAIIRNSTPTLTTSYGDTSKSFYYFSRVDANGKTIFTTALGAVTSADMHVDSAGNVFVSGVTLPGGGPYTSPGAYCDRWFGKIGWYDSPSESGIAERRERESLRDEAESFRIGFDLGGEIRWLGRR
ncbi:MAG TPA: hypothetical protein VGM43_21675 [Bryobacteraceae bacterium]